MSGFANLKGSLAGNPNPPNRSGAADNQAWRPRSVWRCSSSNPHNGQAFPIDTVLLETSAYTQFFKRA
jgi:hypothetical protein